MKKRGMSLIVLTITILVMLMLAAVVILSLQKNNSIDKASEAIFMQDMEELSSSLAQSIADLQIKNSDVNPENINASLLADMRKYIPEFPDEYVGEIQIYKGRIIYAGTETEKLNWAKEIKATKEQIDGTVFSKHTRDKEKSSYKLPYVPDKFVVLSSDKAVVISDDPADENKSINDSTLKGSQFVWIPVDGEKIKFATDYTKSAFDYIDGDGIDIVRESVAKYGGFYMGRYEASLFVDQAAQIARIEIKKGKTPMDGFQYKTFENYSTGMYFEAGNDFVSTLPYGAMWDTACKWLVETNQIPLSAVTTSAIGYGVYNTASLKPTGSTNSNIIIADMAGNAAEWTRERDAKNRSNSIVRGGTCKDTAATGATFAKRVSLLGADTLYQATPPENVSFRVALYIK